MYFQGLEMSRIKKISAIGTRGKAKGREFVAKPDSQNRFVLNKKKASTSKLSTNMAASKVYASTLDEAYRLLETDQYLINLVCPLGTRALRELAKVSVHY